VFTFKSPAWEAATEVEVRFSAEAGGTRVELEHRGFDISPSMRERSKAFANGWEVVLAQYVAGTR
jgi:Activator of Hsp90 ATPase homolog 1-like protein